MKMWQHLGGGEWWREAKDVELKAELPKMDLPWMIKEPGASSGNLSEDLERSMILEGGIGGDGSDSGKWLSKMGPLKRERSPKALNRDGITGEDSMWSCLCCRRIMGASVVAFTISGRMGRLGGTVMGWTVCGILGASVVKIVVTSLVVNTLGVVGIGVVSLVGAWVQEMGWTRLTIRIRAYGDRLEDPIRGPIFLQRASSRCSLLRLCSSFVKAWLSFLISSFEFILRVAGAL